MVPRTAGYGDRKFGRRPIYFPPTPPSSEVSNRANLCNASCDNLRFVREAVEHDVDAVALQSSNSGVTEDGWLPGNSRPLKISRAKPVMGVTLFKGNNAE
jgi:hypothetical protein